MKKFGFKDLIVWQKSYKLALDIYNKTKSFPSYEKYSLSQQIRRSAVSIPSNIAEGYGRYHKSEYKQFLSIAYGSLCELETQYLLSIDLNYFNTDIRTEDLMKETGKMLYRMINPIS
ncbi:MAG: four helix bundle protein [Candidatus Melainabacteria bacterium]|nr:four helix bundle protein [Candidatus Melainabacteria bacterium]MBI3309613.1 four helix bundle protein [Candidatus Melainabacteria bacterium]